VKETSNDGFTQLPFRFAEISRVLLDVCVESTNNKCLLIIPSASDDLPNPDKIRSLLKDLREARQAKARSGLEGLEHSTLGVRLPLNCSLKAHEKSSYPICLPWRSTRSVHFSSKPCRSWVNFVRANKINVGYK
jgi:hypothetical protein